MKRPAEVYTPSRRPYTGLPDLVYPFHDRDALVTACGRICMHRKKINISVGQRLGIKEVDEGIWLASFIDYDLGYIDLEQRNLQPIDNPFGSEVVTHVLGTFRYPCLRAGQWTSLVRRALKANSQMLWWFNAGQCGHGYGRSR